MNRAAPAPLDNMGRPEPRLDGRAKVTGEARYGSDFIVSDVAHAFLITSPIAKGRIASIDTSLAKRLPGVIEVFRVLDAAFRRTGTHFRPLAEEKILNERVALGAFADGGGEGGLFRDRLRAHLRRPFPPRAAVEVVLQRRKKRVAL